MTAAEVKKNVSEMKRCAKQVSASAKKSKDFLVSAGIYTPKGNLKKAYR